MNKTRYSATEFGRNKPMNFRPSGTLNTRTGCRPKIANQLECRSQNTSNGCQWVVNSILFLKNNKLKQNYVNFLRKTVQ